MADCEDLGSAHIADVPIYSPITPCSQSDSPESRLASCVETLTECHVNDAEVTSAVNSILPSSDCVQQSDSSKARSTVELDPASQWNNHSLDRLNVKCHSFVDLTTGVNGK